MLQEAILVFLVPLLSLMKLVYQSLMMWKEPLPRFVEATPPPLEEKIVALPMKMDLVA
jgi:hypothetical protein